VSWALGGWVDRSTAEYHQFGVRSSRVSKGLFSSRVLSSVALPHGRASDTHSWWLASEGKPFQTVSGLRRLPTEKAFDSRSQWR
jgi:hypothetical protein